MRIADVENFMLIFVHSANVLLLLPIFYNFAVFRSFVSFLNQKTIVSLAVVICAHVLRRKLKIIFEDNVGDSFLRFLI